METRKSLFIALQTLARMRGERVVNIANLSFTQGNAVDTATHIECRGTSLEVHGVDLDSDTDAVWVDGEWYLAGFGHFPPRLANTDEIEYIETCLSHKYPVYYNIIFAAVNREMERYNEFYRTVEHSMPVPENPIIPLEEQLLSTLEAISRFTHLKTFHVGGEYNDLTYWERGFAISTAPLLPHGEDGFVLEWDRTNGWHAIDNSTGEVIPAVHWTERFNLPSGYISSVLYTHIRYRWHNGWNYDLYQMAKTYMRGVRNLRSSLDTVLAETDQVIRTTAEVKKPSP